jgi:DNA-binding transcriptional regulator/RsmH inhibitor MraZ
VEGEKMYKGKIKNGWLSFPENFPYEVENRMMICKGINRDLYMFNIFNWKLFESVLNGLPYTSKAVRVFKRFFICSVTETDRKNGGFFIKEYLQEHLENRPADTDIYEVTLHVEEKEGIKKIVVH